VVGGELRNSATGSTTACPSRLAARRRSGSRAWRIWWGIEAGGRFEKLFLVVVVVD
jgi:hypothetical protein